MRFFCNSSRHKSEPALYAAQATPNNWINTCLKRKYKQIKINPVNNKQKYGEIFCDSLPPPPRVLCMKCALCIQYLLFKKYELLVIYNYIYSEKISNKTKKVTELRKGKHYWDKAATN